MGCLGTWGCFLSERLLPAGCPGRYDRLPDAVVLEGPKSGGHQGFTYEQCALEENQLENLVKPVVEEAALWGDIPVIAAGGVWDKNDIEDLADPSVDNVRFTVSYTKDFEL